MDNLQYETDLKKDCNRLTILVKYVLSLCENTNFRKQPYKKTQKKSAR